MATHLREILKQNPKQVEEALKDHSVCVYLQQTRKHDDGQTSFRTYFACCLGCGKHEHCHKMAFRFLHEQWCEKCRAPFEEHCEGCQKNSVRKQYIETNKCDEFITKHQLTCGGAWMAVAPWFNLKVAAPKLAIADRKSERKTERKTLAAPKAKPKADVSARETCNQIAKIFEEQFEEYFLVDPDEPDEEYDEHDLNDYHEQRAMSVDDMLQKIKRSLDNKDFLIQRNTKAAEKNNKQMNEYRNQITKMMELLKSNNIDYNPND
jgi:hypothetical protein